MDTIEKQLVEAINKLGTRWKASYEYPSFAEVSDGKTVWAWGLDGGIVVGNDMEESVNPECRSFGLASVEVTARKIIELMNNLES